MFESHLMTYAISEDHDAPRRGKRISEVDLQIGARIRRQRILNGMSQEALAEALNISFQQIQKYEKGLNRVSASRLAQIAALFGVSMEYFVEGTVEHVPGRARESGERDAKRVTHFLASKQGSQLMASFLQIDDEALRKRLVDLMATLAVRADNG